MELASAIAAGLLLHAAIQIVEAAHDPRIAPLAEMWMDNWMDEFRQSINTTRKQRAALA